MSYVTTNPPIRVTAGGVAGPSLWMYTHATDDRAAVIAQDYFTNGLALGMKIGDFVLHFETANLLGSLSCVNTVDADGTLMVTMVLS